MHHSSFWPDEGVDVKGKRVAVIGTGASGVQISQEWGPQAGSMTLFQRTPNLAVPMGKKPLTKEEQQGAKRHYDRLFPLREQCFGGFFYTIADKKARSDSAEEREAFYHTLWDHGGFGFWLGNYSDMLIDEDSNRLAYDFWAKNQRKRIKNPEKRDLLCPLEPPHPFGVKRPCLEQNYYEVLDQDNVEIVDLNKTPIKEFVEKGIVTSDGKLREFDVIAIATGFDIVTGGMTSMGLKSIRGTNLKDEW
jgi:cation diffusion facilitator CzcD-associated flavoprotein CzcO